jgi:peroxiredoxin
LPDLQGTDVSLHNFSTRQVLLVFLEPHCAPCNAIVSALNAVDDEGDYKVIAVANADIEKVRAWVQAAKVKFPILLQKNRSLSRRFQIVATPFAFLMDGEATIISKGVVTNQKSLSILLTERKMDLISQDSQVEVLQN